MQKNFKNVFEKIQIVYLIFLLSLVYSSDIFKFFEHYFLVHFSESFWANKNLIVSIFLIGLTIWYSLKRNYQILWAVILGFTTIIPGMVWLSVFILLLYKRQGQVSEKAIPPFFSQVDIDNEKKIRELVMWFLLNDKFVDMLRGDGINVLYDKGYRPNVVSKEASKNYESQSKDLIGWFVNKVIRDIKLLRDVKMESFNDLLVLLNKEGNEKLSIYGELGYKYKLKFIEFKWEDELEKIQTDLEKEQFKQTYLDDAVISSETRIFSWLYFCWYGKDFKPLIEKTSINHI